MSGLPPTDDRDVNLAARHRLRERQKLIGLLVIVIFILALTFFRFGRTIPWGAR